MDGHTRKILEEALTLPAEERGELARGLMESLRGEAAPDIERAWAEVITLRANQVLDGTAPTRDLDEALAEIEARSRAAAR